MDKSNDTTIDVKNFEDKAVFDFLSSGKTYGVWKTDVSKGGPWAEEMAAIAGIHCMTDIQNFVAIFRPGPLFLWNDYINNAPCKVPEVAEIAVSTHNVLLYIEQIEEALQLLTGCTPDEAAEFRKRNSSIKLDRVSRDMLLKRIAEHRGVSPEKAVSIYNGWRRYSSYIGLLGIRYSQAEQIAQKIYLKAAAYLNMKKKNMNEF